MKGITLKLLIPVLGTLLISLLSLFFIADRQLQNIIDKSQNQIYEKSLQVLWDELNRSYIRLRQTGLVEAYEKDFQERVISRFEDTYYNNGNLVYPLILNRDGFVVLHPVRQGENMIDLYPWFKTMIDQREGSFIRTYEGEPKWCLFREFVPWGWIICYTVPLSEKYADVRSFRSIFLLILGAITAVIILLISFVMIRFTRPIQSLAVAARRISEGNLEQEIPVLSGDEIGDLAGSFNDMQDSINRKIGDLNREIVERKRVEDELKKAQSLVSNIIDSMPSSLIGVDPEGRVTHWNSSAEAMTGVPGSEARGRFLYDVVPSRKRDKQNLFEAMEKGEVSYISGQVRQKGEKTFIEDITVYPLGRKAAQGAVIRIDDVTEKTLLEEKLAHSQKMDAIGQLAAGVAHDFNNMLAGISGAASLLKPICTDVEKAESFINLILEASERASGLTARLLAFGRKGSLEISSIDIREVLDDTVSLLERTIDKSIVIRKEEDAENPFLMANFTAVQNSLMNLAINASHAMPLGGSLTFSVKNCYLDKEFCMHSPFEIEPGDYISLGVEDSGSGIPSEYLDRIYDPFFTTKGKGKGTGLGLASVYAAVRDHGGAIEVKSQVKKGTAFTLYFPCTAPPSEARAAVSDEESEGSGTILLVDDEEMIRFTVRAQLEAIGYSVITAPDGREALEMWESEKENISLIISDMIMPEMSGRELFHELMRRNSSCPFIIMSGYTRDENLHEMISQGLSGFMQKPFTHNELVEHLQKALNPQGKENQ